MRTRNPKAAPPRSVKHPVAFPSPDDITTGTVLFDRDYEMPGTVRGTDGPMVEMERPTGLIWRANYRRLRPATDWEHRQLVAVGKLHAVRQRGRRF
ncbi:hypothetical protein [Streptomyces melanogenes]|uniref:hypothetical protein n=1 Tax=Streptomyces melanogenes TaxID=67326 RepID=UPI00198F066A|nr:hypothetical protein [Streptomyces melanogenes]GGP96016.1 hypothetical protein GCM10010278_87000 [Streptomyces melanogenes]